MVVCHGVPGRPPRRSSQRPPTLAPATTVEDGDAGARCERPPGPGHVCSAAIASAEPAPSQRTTIGPRLRVASHPRGLRPPVVPVIVELVAPAGQDGVSRPPWRSQPWSHPPPFAGVHRRSSARVHAGQEPARFGRTHCLGALKIGRSAVRPRPWPLPLTSGNAGSRRVSRPVPSQLSSQSRPRTVRRGCRLCRDGGRRRRAGSGLPSTSWTTP